MITAANRIVVGLVLIAALIAGGVMPASADELVISSQTKSFLDQYLGTRQPLAFAVSADGTHAGYVYCEDYGCRNKDYRNQALGQCAQAGGKDCKILAVGHDIKLAYRVDPSRNLLPTPTPATPAAPDCGNKSEAECTAMLVRAYEQKRHAVEAQWAKKIDEIKDMYCRPSWSNVGRCRNYVARAEGERDAELEAVAQEFQHALAN